MIKKEMNICLFDGNAVNNFPLHNYGGVESCVFDLATQFKKLNLKFFVVTSGDRDLGKTQNIDGISVVRSGPSLTDQKQTQAAYYHNHRVILDNLREDDKPDIIIGQSHEMVQPMLGYRKFNQLVPILATFHDALPKQTGWMINDPQVFYRFLSQFQYNNWVKEPWEAKRSFQLYTGVRNEEFQFYDASERSDHFLWCGSVSAQKGLDIFFQLSQVIKGGKFIAYGTGDPADIGLTPEVIAENTNFEWRGVLERGMSHIEAFGKCRAFIMPTQLPYDTFPRTILEALSKGTPVIGTTVASLPETLNGFGFCGYDLRDLAFALTIPFDNQQIFSRAANKYSVQVEARELVQQLENIVNHASLRSGSSSESG